MGQITYALIEHALTPEEILELPKTLRSVSNNNIAGKWIWSNPNFDIDFLKGSWENSLDIFSPWSEQDFPWLQKNSQTLDFFTPNLVAFDELIKWFWLSENDTKIDAFSKLTCEIATLIKAVDMILIPEISDEFVQEHKHLTVDLFRQNCIAAKQPFLEVRRNII